jgi:hypothetical protein
MSNVSVFVTDGSDLESYFLSPEHIAELCGITAGEMSSILDKVAVDNHNAIVTRFNDKRQALHKQFGSRGVLATTDSLRATSIPLPSHQRVGKDMLGWVESELKTTGLLAVGGTLVVQSPALHTPNLLKAVVLS